MTGENAEAVSPQTESGDSQGSESIPPDGSPVRDLMNPDGSVNQLSGSPDVIGTAEAGLDVMAHADELRTIMENETELVERLMDMDAGASDKDIKKSVRQYFAGEFMDTFRWRRALRNK